MNRPIALGHAAFAAGGASVIAVVFGMMLGADVEWPNAHAEAANPSQIVAQAPEPVSVEGEI